VSVREDADSLEELSVYGFEVEPFGKASFRINAVISTLADRDVAGAFREAVSAMKGTVPGMSREQRILATIVCHSAVKLGDRLAHQEMEALIKDWLTSRYPATCPHDRSICYRLEHKEIPPSWTDTSQVSETLGLASGSRSAEDLSPQSGS
jgi:DNA mismatch repair protein MutL